MINYNKESDLLPRSNSALVIRLMILATLLSFVIIILILTKIF